MMTTSKIGLHPQIILSPPPLKVVWNFFDDFSPWQPNNNWCQTGYVIRCLIYIFSYTCGMQIKMFKSNQMHKQDGQMKCENRGDAQTGRVDGNAQTNIIICHFFLQNTLFRHCLFFQHFEKTFCIHQWCPFHRFRIFGNYSPDCAAYQVYNYQIVGLVFFKSVGKSFSYHPVFPILSPA